VQKAQYSSLAFFALALNALWIWVHVETVWILWTRRGRVAGEIFLAPFLSWQAFGFAALVGVAIALRAIERSGGRIRGKWVAISAGVLALGGGISSFAIYAAWLAGAFR
jgi:hypothetical protein